MLLNKEHLVSLRSIPSDTAYLPLFPNIPFLKPSSTFGAICLSQPTIWGRQQKQKTKPYLATKPLQAKCVLANLNSLNSFILKEDV